MFNTIVLRYSSLACLAGLLLALGACVAAPAPTPAAETPKPAAEPVSAPASLEGTWEGSIDVANQKIGIVVRLSGSGGELKGLMDIPAQAAKDIPLDKLSYDSPKVHFETFPGQRLATYDGEIKADGSIAGDFSQAGFKGTFTLVPATQAVPTEVLPYKAEEVTVKNGDVTLAGTLTLPETGGPFPAVILVSGSGQQNRDEDIFGFQPFRLIADHFTRNGIAVLRLDDRGIGGSTGDIENATSEDFAGDIAAAVEVLKGRADINPQQIGLVGHSEGGLIAPMVANRNPAVSFVILMAGPGLTGEEIIARQVADLMRVQGASQADIDNAVARQREVMQTVITGEGWDELEAELRKQAEAQVAALPDEQKKALGDEKAAVEQALQGQLSALKSPWYKFFLTHDPAPQLAELDVPVLALFGGKDVQVAAEPNEKAMKEALAKGGNTQATTRIYPEANHVFQPATTGGIEEYGQLKSFIPGLLDDMVEWIKDVVKE